MQKPAGLMSTPSPSNTGQTNHKPATIVVTQRHLVEAASNMRPSVSPAERFKYQQMYV